jgi:hypothetical protein
VSTDNPSLLQIAKTQPEAFSRLNIPQILAICGDGQLLDGSKCSEDLRWYLGQQAPLKLAEYARYCLDNSFPKSGAVLQDILNEIGRRLGFDVIDGRYSGTTRDNGFDGLWKEGSASLVLEAKTSDAYRINLDKVVAYARRAQSEGLAENEPKVLMVVGREDTGDLEAQIRGSRHAWQVRLVSVESLLKLMFVRSEISARTFTDKVRKILFPFEYTRVDEIIDLVFETQREVEEKLVDVDTIIETGDEVEGRGSSWQFTPAEELDAKRDALLARFYSSHNASRRRITRSKYLDDSKNIRVTCTISKRYQRDYQPYWYAFHPAWLEFLEQGSEGYLILGCMDRIDGFALPLDVVRSKLQCLNTTEAEGKHYWHISLQIDGDDVFLNMSKTGERLSLSPYRF